MRFTNLLWLGVAALILNVVIPGVWTALLIANIKATPSIPWAIPGMAIVLWLFWQYMNGRWAPASTSDLRQRLMRARNLPRAMFFWALAAGFFGILSLTGLWIILANLTRIPGNATLRGLNHYPRLSSAVFLVTASVVTAIVEEATVRGYFQAGLETRISGTLAITLPVVLFFPLHGLTQGFALTTFLFYLFADSMFGGMAYTTKSILPGVIVHAVGILIFFTLIWPNDASRSLISQKPPTAWFWIHVAQFSLFLGASIAAFLKLKDFGLKSDRTFNATSEMSL